MDFLTRLAERALDKAPTVTPVVPSLFAAPSGTSTGVEDLIESERFGEAQPSRPDGPPRLGPAKTHSESIAGWPVPAKPHALTPTPALLIDPPRAKPPGATLPPTPPGATPVGVQPLPHSTPAAPVRPGVQAQAEAPAPPPPQQPLLPASERRDQPPAREVTRELLHDDSHCPAQRIRPIEPVPMPTGNDQPVLNLPLVPVPPSRPEPAKSGAAQPALALHGERRAAAAPIPSAAPVPSIQVRIGRVDVRAILPPASAPAARRELPGPKLRLEDYLLSPNGARR